MSEEELIECMKNSHATISPEEAIQTIVCFFEKQTRAEEKIGLFVKIVQYDQQLY